MKLKFDELTDHQREVLFSLIAQTEHRGSRTSGVWVLDDSSGRSVFVHYICIDREGEVVMPWEEWKTPKPESLAVYTTIQNLQVLAKHGYIELSDKEVWGKTQKTTWRRLLLTQKALDLYSLMHRSSGVKFLIWLWHRAKQNIPLLQTLRKLIGL